MARIAGVNIPVQKHTWVGLTHIYGIGKTRAFQICEAAGVAPETKIRDLTEAEEEALRAEVAKFTVEGDRLYNVAYLFRRDGTLEKQYKLHITPSERKWWGVTHGDRVHVFETDRGRIAILICYDIEFPEIVRIAVRKGAQILFVPFNTDERHGYLRVRICAQARASPRKRVSARASPSKPDRRTLSATVLPSLRWTAS